MHQRVIDVAVILEVAIEKLTEDRVQDGVGDNVRRVEEGLVCVALRCGCQTKGNVQPTMTAPRAETPLYSVKRRVQGNDKPSYG
jgi:hypothetical protein